MMSQRPILECVPNFSEGRDASKINAIAASIRSVNGAHLLHIDTSPSANRTVMTFAGEPAAITEAAYRAIKTAGELIDMTKQEGVHPRVGATDVCPLVPLTGLTMEDAVKYSNILGERVGRELNIPVYLYEYSATAKHRKALPDIRKGQFEGMAEKIKHSDWKPDYGPSEFNVHTGATVIGARDVLVAFNISLDTKDVTKANYIAEHVRSRGFKNSNGEKINGLLPKLRAIGWYMADFECAQVSMNLLDYRITSPLQVWETVKAVADEVGVSLVGSELIGLMPEACLIETGTFSYLKQQQKVPSDKNMIVHAAIEYLGLNKVKPFEPQEKILEYALHHAQLI